MNAAFNTTPVQPPSGGRFLVILPTYNERDNLERMVDGISAVRAHAPFPGDVLIVDDNSPDGTGDVADRLAELLDWVHVIHRSGKLGLAQAYIAGFEWGLMRGYSHLFEMDADLSHPPEAIVRMLSVMVDADLVIGSRYVRRGAVVGWAWHRRVISRAGCLYGRGVLGLGVADVTSGFKCFRRCVLEAIDLDSIRSDGYVFQIELTYRTARMGGRVMEIPITFADRSEGRSKMTWAIVAEAVWRVPWLRLRPPRDPPLPVVDADRLPLAA
jgi:dolichol-phosphate mannosyltransferase